ncbi:MAG: helix-turn-helix transcriptional regulator [Ruminococcaceae bacterium]|nr:helix-turn-helix transcriptional regulator [Oscillospiraceae bacterium]
MTVIIIDQKIRDYRKSHKLTQEAFGELLGISPQAVSKWERVECYPDITFLPELAKMFGCRVDDFFEGR